MTSKTAWTPDACLDAHGFTTIRAADGTEHGDTDAPTIATVYDPTHARLIALAPEMADELAKVERDLMNRQRDDGYAKSTEYRLASVRAILSRLPVAK